MVNMIKSDIYRLLRSKGFYILIALIIGTYAISIVSKSSGGLSFGMNMPDNAANKIDIQQVGRNFSFYYFFIMLAYMINVADFSMHTIKNTLTSAVSRTTYYIAKFVTSLLLMVVTFMISNVFFYAVNVLINGGKYSSNFGDFIKPVFMQLPMIIGAGAVLIMAAFILKKGVSFISVTVITPMAYTSIALAIYVIGNKKIAEKLLTYELDTALHSIANEHTHAYLMNCTYIGIAALVISVIIGYMAFRKTEIK